MTEKKDIPGMDPKTIEWQCTGCNHLCRLLTDRLIIPDDVIKCSQAEPNFKICE